MLGLYVHIPFCSAICNYCNFNRGLFDEPQKARLGIVLELHFDERNAAGWLDRDRSARPDPS